MLFGLLTVLGLHCGVQDLLQLWRVNFSLVPQGLLIVEYEAKKLLLVSFVAPQHVGT